MASNYETLKDLARINLNDKFIGTDGCPKLADFLATHRKIEALELKCNEIDSEGFHILFRALRQNPTLRYLILEYNHLGRPGTEGVEELAALIPALPKLEVLTLANNQLTDLTFDILIPALAQSRSLKLVSLNFNTQLTNRSIEKMTDELKRARNANLLFVDVSGIKVDKNVLSALEEVLSSNRKQNPIDKAKLMVVNVRESMTPSMSQTGFHKTQVFYTQQQGQTAVGAQGFEQLSRDNMLRNLESILEQNRKETAEMKVRLERELQELQRREKLDSRELTDLDTKCNQLVLVNRNLKFELDRTVSEHQQMQRDHSLQLRTHDEKLREASRELGEVQSRYQEIADRMNKEHAIRMKEIDREWEMKLRAIEEKIRVAEADNNDIQNELKKTLEKRERARLELAEEEASVTLRVEEEEAQRYNLRLQSLETKLAQIQEAREHFLKRNNDIVYELEETEAKNHEEITNLQSQILELQQKQDAFLKKHKEFVAMNERLTAEIRLKEVSFEKLEAEINSLNEQIEYKKKFNREQVDRVLNEQAYQKTKWLSDRETQRAKLAELERVLRASQIQNARLRQEYVALAETVQVNVNRAIEGVFSANNLF